MFQIPEKKSGLLKAPMETSLLSSSFKVFVSLFFAPVVIPHIKQPQVEQLPVFFFVLCNFLLLRQGKTCYSGQLPSQIEYRQLNRWGLTETH